MNHLIRKSAVTSLFVLWVLLFIGELSAPAQQENPCARTPVPSATVTLFTTTDVSSKTAAAGEEIELRVDGDIRIDDCLLIAKGAVARGRIKAVQKPKSFSRPGKLEIGLESIQTASATDGVALGGSGIHVTGGNDLIAGALLLPGGAGLFIAPILFPLPGGQAQISAGTTFEASLPPDLILDGIPVEPPTRTDALLIVFRTPQDPLPNRGKVICMGKQLFCFGSGRYLELSMAPGEYKVQGFGRLELHSGETVYLRQMPSSRASHLGVRTGGGLFEFFLPGMKQILVPDADEMRRRDIKGPIARRGAHHE